jgi:AcrR family transcriptional regulator
MTVARFTDLRTLDDIARATGTPTESLARYASAADQFALYQVLRIPKRGKHRAGQFRVVYAVSDGILGNFHRMIALMLGKAIKFEPHVQGFVQRRSIFTNASAHLGARSVMHADIADFFDAVTTEQVAQGFESLGAPGDLAMVLARACTINGRLRQGTRCAPAIANLVCRAMDQELLGLAAVHGARYTRYADDIVISGDEVPAVERVASILERHGFVLRQEKCRIQRRGAAQFVTGLHVGDATQPRLQRRLKKRLRLVLHYIEKFGVDSHFSRQKGGLRFVDPHELAGLLRFAQSVEPALAKKLRAQFRVGSAMSRDASDPGHDLDGDGRGSSGT